MENMKETVVCPYCGHENDADARACASCGEELIPALFDDDVEEETEDTAPAGGNENHAYRAKRVMAEPIYRPGSGAAGFNSSRSCKTCGTRIDAQLKACPICGDGEETEEEENRRRKNILLLCVLATILAAILIITLVLVLKGVKKPGGDGSGAVVTVTATPIPAEATPAPTAEPTMAPTEAPVPTKAPEVTAAPTAAPTATPVPVSRTFTFGGEEFEKGTDSIVLKGADNKHPIHITAEEMDDLITYCPGLTTLDLDFCYLDDYSDIGRLTDLTTLELKSCTGNPVQDISWISNLTELTKLNLVNNDVRKVSPLTKCTNITWLNLGGNKKIQSDVCKYVGKLTRLTELYLYSCNLYDLEGLENLDRLVTLNLRSNPDVWLDPYNDYSAKGTTLDQVIDHLPRLRTLLISGTSVDGFYALEDTDITTLWIDNLSHFSFSHANGYQSLQNMKKLKTLCIGKKDKNFNEADLKAALPGVKIKLV